MARKKDIPLLVLDIDGTVRHGKEELGHFVNGPDDVVVFPEAITLIKRWAEAGGTVLGLSNQGGIALGLVEEEVVRETFRETLLKLESAAPLVEMIIYCPHHPKAEDPYVARCWCRKPSPGLLVQWLTAQEIRFPSFRYPPHMGLFVGDMGSDHTCADLAGFPFKWAADWRAEA